MAKEFNLNGFLDDILYNYVKSFKMESPVDFEILLNDLYSICEQKYKPQLSEYMFKKEVANILDKTFKSWDLMVAKLSKEEWFLVDMLEKYSYKYEFMKNERLKDIYNDCKSSHF